MFSWRTILFSWRTSNIFLRKICISLDFFVTLPHKCNEYEKNYLNLCNTDGAGCLSLFNVHKGGGSAVYSDVFLGTDGHGWPRNNIFLR